jgi:signal transduction histidine kinase/HAMP domain-containing protein
VKLREAASTIFALTTILPLLVFVYFMWRFGLLESTEAQVGIFFALAIALLGYVLFRRLTQRVSDLGRALGQALNVPGAQAEKKVARAPVSAPKGSATAAVPGLGQVNEIGEIAQAFGRMLVELRASTERLEDLVFKLGALNDMVEMAARIPRIEDLLSHVLERTMRAVSAGIGSIMLLDRDRQTLRIAVGRGLQEAGRGPVEVKVGEGIAGKVVEMGEAVVVEDIEKDPRFGRSNDPRYGGGSFICMPLRVAERIVGVVNLSKKEVAPGGTGVFSQTDLQFLNALATYTAYAVDNARLFEEAQQATQRLQEVVEDQKLRLSLAQQQMIQAAKLSALGELVAGVAHELNNPLTVLVGASDILEQQAPDDLKEYAQMIREATDAARHIVRGLLTFGRQMPLERRHVMLDELIDKVLALTAADLRIESVKIDRDMEADLPPVWADGNQLQQVLVNLVTNAKQAMAEQPEAQRRLKVITRSLGPDRVRISLEDTGPGIPADVLPKIFDPFVTTKGSAGTGLGLSISYGIIREHGGHITADSRPGHGATFTIDLPVGSAGGSAPDAGGSSVNLDGKRILIVEHDQAVQKILLEHLEPTGCTALTVARADEARQHLRDGIDLVVADFNLDGVDWLELLGQVAARGAAVGHRFIFITAGPGGEAADRALRHVGAALLYKPFTGAQFLDAVRATAS